MKLHRSDIDIATTNPHRAIVHAVLAEKGDVIGDERLRLARAINALTPSKARNVLFHIRYGASPIASTIEASTPGTSLFVEPTLEPLFEWLATSSYDSTSHPTEYPLDITYVHDVYKTFTGSTATSQVDDAYREINDSINAFRRVSAECGLPMNSITRRRAALAMQLVLVVRTAAQGRPTTPLTTMTDWVFGTPEQQATSGREYTIEMVLPAFTNTARADVFDQITWVHEHAYYFGATTPFGATVIPWSELAESIANDEVSQDILNAAYELVSTAAEEMAEHDQHYELRFNQRYSVDMAIVATHVKRHLLTIGSRLPASEVVKRCRDTFTDHDVRFAAALRHFSNPCEADRYAFEELLAQEHRIESGSNVPERFSQIYQELDIKPVDHALLK